MCYKINMKNNNVIGNIREKARSTLLKNFEATGGRYITPAWPHYKHQWMWDSCFHAIACAELGMHKIAINEITTFLEFQDERGFIPHQIHRGIFKWKDLEQWLYKDGGWGIPRFSSIIAPPLLAQAVDAIDDDKFTLEIIEKIVKFYKYFIKYRDAENILSVFTPRETGRDSDPNFDFFRLSAPKFLGFLDTVFDYISILKLEWQYKRMNWDEDRIMKANIFHVKDLATHCIWVDGLYSLKKLLVKINKENLFENIDEVISKAEHAVFEKSWDSADKMFYCIREGYGVIKRVSVSNLFPLLLKNISYEMKKSLVNKITDTHEFWTAYPIPSVSLSDKAFNPLRTWPIWRGPTWINANWFLIRALVRHGHVDIAQTISNQTIDMVSREGFWEFYNPFTGKGLRVDNFGWSTLVVTFPKILEG